MHCSWDRLTMYTATDSTAVTPSEDPRMFLCSIEWVGPDSNTFRCHLSRGSYFLQDGLGNFVVP